MRVCDTGRTVKMTVEKCRENRLLAMETAWISAAFAGKLTKPLRNVDKASAHVAIVDEHFRNIDFQLKKVFEILCFDESSQGVLNSYLCFLVLCSLVLCSLVLCSLVLCSYGALFLWCAAAAALFEASGDGLILFSRALATAGCSFRGLSRRLAALFEGFRDDLPLFSRAVVTNLEL